MSSSTPVSPHQLLPVRRAVRPRSGDTRAVRPSAMGRLVPADGGVSAHPKVDPATDELLFFNYTRTPPYLHFGVADADNSLVHTPIELPGLRLLHDMAFTEHFVILNDCPLFWDPRCSPTVGSTPCTSSPTCRRASACCATATATRSAGSMRRRRTCCTGSTPTRKATWSSSTASRAQPRSGGRTRGWRTSTRQDAAEQRMFRFLDATAAIPCPYRWRSTSPPAGQGGAPVRPRQRVRHDQWQPPRPAVPLLLLAAARAGLVLFNGLRRTDVETSETVEYRCDDGVFVSEAQLRPEGAAPPRTMATSSPSRRTSPATAPSASCSPPPTSPPVRSPCGCRSGSAPARTAAGCRTEPALGRCMRKS